VEVDEGHLIRERGAESAVVGLIYRAGPVVVENRSLLDVEFVLVWSSLARNPSSGHQSQRGGTDHLAQPMDSLLEGTETDPFAPERKALLEGGNGHEVVVALP
jgi:hypothetical protein